MLSKYEPKFEKKSAVFRQIRRIRGGGGVTWGMTMKNYDVVKNNRWRHQRQMMTSLQLIFIRLFVFLEKSFFKKFLEHKDVRGFCPSKLKNEGFRKKLRHDDVIDVIFLSCKRLEMVVDTLN